MTENIYHVSPEGSDLPFFITISGISYCDGSYHIVRNSSDIMCIEYVIDGYGTVKVDGKEYYPQKDDIYMLPIGSNHDYFSDSEKPWTKIWFNASGPLIKNIISSYGFDNTVVIKNTNALRYFKEITELCKSDINTFEINARAALIFHSLISYLYSITRKQSTAISKDALIMRNYIDVHITENISLEKLASLIYKSKSQAIRIFKNEVGLTPYDYLLGNRLALAKSLLKNTNLLIKEIAFRTGFNDEHYFSDIFKRKCGTTPRQYRNKI
jgi:AraC-like DNA-binding protein